MAAEMKQVDPNLTFEMVESGGGIFDVTYNGKVLFSKFDTGRFPNKGEIAALIHQ